MQRSEGDSLTYLGATESVIDDLMKKAQEIGQIQPEPAIEAPGIEPSAEQCVMPLNHHVAVALQTMHSISVCALSFVRKAFESNRSLVSQAHSTVKSKRSTIAGDS